MRLGLPVLALAVLGACSEAPPAPGPVETDVPAELRGSAGAASSITAESAIGTPMKDRVATIGVLNKRNNIAQDLTMKPGETRRIGEVIVALKSCERTAPWEMPQETGAFVQVFVQQRGTRREGEQPGFAKVFSGWLFRNSPSLNVVEHPIYDVWVKDCAMRFPGEEAPAPGERPPSAGTPRAAATPSPSASASPSPPASPSPAVAAPNEATD